jgi:ADP-heptose:LPS heptosyltransferase
MIGDVLLDTPVLRALRMHYPHSHITFCTEAAPADVLQGNPDIDEVLLHPRPAPWYQELRFLRRVRRRRFDLVIDLMGNPRSAMLTYLSGAPHRIAFTRFPRSLCYTKRVDHQHEVQGYTVIKRLRLLEPLGIQASDLSLRFDYTQQHRHDMTHFLDTQGVRPQDFLICVDPTSYISTREWPSEKFAQLIDLMHGRLGARVCLLWGPRDHDKVHAIAALARSNPLLNPPWELSHIAALLARADLFVGCVSAPLHIAVSQNTPSLTIFGATPSVNWLPPSPQHRAIALGLPCQPCSQDDCGPPLNTACLHDLSVETVFEAVLASHPWVSKLQRYQQLT